MLEEDKKNGKKNKKTNNFSHTYVIASTMMTKEKMSLSNLIVLVLFFTFIFSLLIRGMIPKNFTFFCFLPL